MTSGKWKIIPVFLISFLFSFNAVFPQDVTARLRNDTNNVLIGDWIRLKLEVASGLKNTIIWPQFPDSVGSVEILSKSKIDTFKSDKGYKFSQTLVVTCFDSGVHVVPPFIFSYQKAGDSSAFTVNTDSLLLTFHTVSVDTSKSIKDIKPVMDEPMTLADYLGIIGIILGIIIISVAGYFLWKRFRRKPREVLAYDPKIPAHVAALAELDRLENEKLWQKGQVKLYYIRLTEIVRVYIERRFSVLALEMTTHEIISALEKISLEKELTKLLNTVFERADLVKFAKFQPLPDENSLSMSESVRFVNSTIASENYVEQGQTEEEKN